MFRNQQEHGFEEKCWEQDTTTDLVNWLPGPNVWQTARANCLLPTPKEFAMSLVKIIVITIIVLLSLLFFGRFFV
jgi:hypothetical protein